MLGENADRRSAAPISSATEWKIFLKISSRVGSTRPRPLVLARIPRPLPGLPQQHLAIGVHVGPPAAWHQRRSAIFRYHRWPGEGIPRPKRLPHDQSRRLSLSVQSARQHFATNDRYPACPPRNSRQARLVRDPGGTAAYVHNLNGPFPVVIAITL